MRLRKEFVLGVAFFLSCIVLFRYPGFVFFPSSSMAASMGTPSVSDGFFVVDGHEVHCKQSKPTNSEKGVTVILLHGAAFSSQTWEETGTLQHLAGNGVLAFALDLPGYGKTESADLDDKADFLKAVVDYVDGDVKVVVSPSMSGSFSVQYVNKYGTEIDGYVPVAPVSVAKLDPPKSLSVFAVAGELDARAVQDLAVFKKTFDNFDQLIVFNGPHPAYLKDPELFNSKLTDFALSLKK